MKVTIIPSVIGALGTVITIDTRTERLENNRTSGNHSSYCIMEIGQNTEENPGDLNLFSVTQTPVKDDS